VNAAAKSTTDKQTIARIFVDLATARSVVDTERSKGGDGVFLVPDAATVRYGEHHRCQE